MAPLRLESGNCPSHISSLSPRSSNPIPKHITTLSPSVHCHHSCPHYHYPITPWLDYCKILWPGLSVSTLIPSLIHSSHSNQKDLFGLQMSSSPIFSLYFVLRITPSPRGLCGPLWSGLLPFRGHSLGSFSPLNPFQSVWALLILEHTKLFAAFCLTAFSSFHWLVDSCFHIKYQKSLSYSLSLM